MVELLVVLFTAAFVVEVAFFVAAFAAALVAAALCLVVGVADALCVAVFVWVEAGAAVVALLPDGLLSPPPATLSV